MKQILTAVSAIDDVLNSECVYVDKTAYMHKLITCKDRLFFISRPRRFGKSLMLSTLKAIFEGRRELFEGTDISKLDYEWQEYPVLYFDMANAVGKSVDAVLDGLNTLAMSAAEQLELDIVRNDDPAQTFLNFWNAVAKEKKQVVVLVDEYDVPLQGFLRDRDNLEVLRKAMHDFYVRFKSFSGSIKFLMMTGVTKLTKLSVFSGLNNPIDLTMDGDYAGMLGYTREELEANFSDHIDAFAAKQNMTREALIDKLLEWYDNYRFSPESDVNVVNPVSVGLSLSKCAFKNFWMSTGKSSIVIEHLRATGNLPSDLDHMSAFEEELDVCDAVVETNDAVYVFEFKYGHTAQEAFDQILKNRYYESYLASGKPIYGIGLNFNPTEGSRGIDDPVVGKIKN